MSWEDRSPNAQMIANYYRIVYTSQLQPTSACSCQQQPARMALVVPWVVPGWQPWVILAVPLVMHVRIHIANPKNLNLKFQTLNILVVKGSMQIFERKGSTLTLKPNLP